VAALTARDPAVEPLQRERAGRSAERHIDFAIRALRKPTAGTVYLVGGLVGSGKSTVARWIAAETGAVMLSSDRIRHRILGEPGQRSRWREGRYALAAILRVYEGLLERAAPVAESGRAVILDASWSRRGVRDRARAFAAERKTRCVFVEVRCPRTVALARLAQRQREGRDPSEAGPELYDRFAASFEPLDATIEWSPSDHWVIDTKGASWHGVLAKQLANASP